MEDQRINDEVPASEGVERQREIHSRCYHPTGTCAEVFEDDIDGPLPARFERQVERYAERVAITDETHTLTYEDTNNRANRIANRLLAEKPAAGEPVVALLDEGVDRIATFLGILKAGACHLAIDPALPRERQRFMVEQSGARIILTQAPHGDLGRELAGDGCRVIDIDEDTVDSSVNNPSLMIAPDDNCLIVYTSGSTGQPKGVVHTHRNLLHDLRTYVEGFHISHEDRLSLLMSLTTSAGCFGTLMALGCGAALCRINVQGLGVEHMAREVARHELTIWGGVPSLFRQWMNIKQPDYSHLRLVWFGGEAVQARDFHLYRQNLGPSCIFVNRLGSTETQCTRMFYADHQTRIPGTTVPVGYPVPGQEILLKDSGTRLVEAPGTGEIVVRSAYLSTGYWRRPDLTESAYAALDDGSNRREYCTGDLGELDTHGCLTYCGRKDFQVKVRGYRVETAEVETLFDRLDSIREASVVGEPLDEGGHELVAYLVPAQAPGPGIPELRQELARHVPDHMIPTRFLYLEELPRAANGKVIRSELGSAASIPIPPDSPSRYPETPMEKMLAGFWQEVLDLDRSDGSDIGVNENFFDLGGHSLKVSQVQVRILEQLSINVPFPTFFDCPTIEELAQEIEQQTIGKNLN